MKLNLECVRELLIFLEENLSIEFDGLPEIYEFNEIIDKNTLSEFSQEEIYYAARKLVEAKLISVVNKNVAPSDLQIKEITWDGHDYLDSIRDSKVWHEVKQKTKGLSSVGLEVIKSIAVEVTKGMLGLNS